LLQPEKEKAEKTATATAEEANFIHQRIMQNYAKKKERESGKRSSSSNVKSKIHAH